MKQASRSKLAPLEPDGFLAWLYRLNPPLLKVFGYTGMGMPTFKDLLWDVQREVRMDRALLRKVLIERAARVRRNQRLGRDPFTPYVRSRRCASAA